MNFNVNQTFFKKLSREIWRFSMHEKHKSLIIVIKKKLPGEQLYVQTWH